MSNPTQFFSNVVRVDVMGLARGLCGFVQQPFRRLLIHDTGTPKALADAVEAASDECTTSVVVQAWKDESALRSATAIFTNSMPRWIRPLNVGENDS